MKMDKVIETLEELTQITATMPETRFQMALVRAISELNRCRQLEADCAAMREAWEQAHDLSECSYHVGVYTHMGYTEMQQRWAGEAQEILVNMKQALSSSAGKDLLERVQRLEAVAEAAKFLFKLNQHGCTSQIGENELAKALATLEGGTE
jgi:hypothetical protein